MRKVNYEIWPFNFQSDTKTHTYGHTESFITFGFFTLYVSNYILHIIYFKLESESPKKYCDSNSTTSEKNDFSKHVTLPTPTSQPCLVPTRPQSFCQQAQNQVATSWILYLVTLRMSRQLFVFLSLSPLQAGTFRFSRTGVTFIFFDQLL